MQRGVREGSTSNLGDGISLGVERFHLRGLQDEADSCGIANIADSYAKCYLTANIK